MSSSTARRTAVLFSDEEKATLLTSLKRGATLGLHDGGSDSGNDADDELSDSASISSISITTSLPHSVAMEASERDAIEQKEVKKDPADKKTGVGVAEKVV